MTRNRHGFSGAPRKKEEIVISEGVTPEWIEPFYAGYDCDKHKARCAGCNKPELMETKSSWHVLDVMGRSIAQGNVKRLTGKITRRSARCTLAMKTPNFSRVLFES